MKEVKKQRKQEGDFSLFSNLSEKADKATQTVSKKKLIRGILHGVGMGQRVELGDPIMFLDTNINLYAARLKKQRVNEEIINNVRNQAKRNVTSS